MSKESKGLTHGKMLYRDFYHGYLLGENSRTRLEEL
jgi:hypothetical protein